MASCAPASTPAPATETPLPPTQTSPPPTSTIPAPTITPSPRPTQTAPSIIQVSQNGVNFGIPYGLASGAIFATMVGVEYPYINPSSGDMPSHTVITLNDYPIPGRSARILIFKAADYATYTELTQSIINALDSYPAQPNDVVPQDLQTTFDPQAKRVASDYSYRLCYLTQVMDAFVPINNQNIFYYYQGLTTDKVYFIEAIFQVTADFLVADKYPGSVTPADGVLFPIEVNGTTMHEYLDAMKTKLDSTAPSAFFPSLDQLDALVRSIHLSP